MREEEIYQEMRKLNKRGLKQGENQKLCPDCPDIKVAKRR